MIVYYLLGKNSREEYLIIYYYLSMVGRNFNIFPGRKNS
jgi:hypothetical protein